MVDNFHRKKNKVGKLLIKKKPAAAAAPEKKYRDRAAERRSKFGSSEPVVRRKRPEADLPV